MSSHIYNHDYDKIPIYKNYDLDQRFLKKQRVYLGWSLAITILVLVVFLLIRPGNVLKNVQKNYDNDREYNYMIYTHIGSYLMGIFSVSLLLALLNSNKLTTNMIIYPSFILCLKVLALAAYYFYYTNSVPNGYNFSTDYFGWIYMVLTIILFSLYLTIFIKAIQEKNRMRKNNSDAGKNMYESSSVNDLINDSYRKIFSDTRVNPTTEDWLKSYVRKNLKNNLDRRDLEYEIDQEMLASKHIYDRSEQFFNREVPQYENSHELFTSYLNHYYSDGAYESTIPPHMMKADLRGNEFLNPKLIFYIEQLVSRGDNNEQIMDQLPFANDSYGDTRERINNYINQIKSVKKFRNFRYFG